MAAEPESGPLQPVEFGPEDTDAPGGPAGQRPWRPAGTGTELGRAELPVATVAAAAYTVPTERPEADGTLAWDATTIVLVRAGAGPDRPGNGLELRSADVERYRVR